MTWTSPTTIVPAIMLIAAGAVVVVAVTSGSQADRPAIAITDAYATPALSEGTSAIYFTVANNQDADHITGITTNAGGEAAFYRSTDKSTEMGAMNAVATVAVPGNAAMSLEPGGLHAMAGPTTSELRSGDELTVTVEFERADDISVRVMVRSFGDIAAMPAVSDRSPS